jgi:hypothetical protein
VALPYQWKAAFGARAAIALPVLSGELGLFADNDRDLTIGLIISMPSNYRGQITTIHLLTKK